MFETYIIHDEMPLKEVYIPEKMYHRDGEIKRIARVLSPVIKNRDAGNLFIHGPTGTGKTTIIKYMFNVLNSETSNVATIYVNCWKYSTVNSLLNQILMQLNKSKALFSTRRTNSELIKDIEVEVEKKNKKLIIALDEIDRVESMDVLYFLSREKYALVLISNDAFALKDVDMRIKSSLLLEEIEFKKYKVEELVDILKDRASYALVPDSVSDALLKLIAMNSNGDARVALEILRKSAMNAEIKEKKKIERQDIIDAVRSIKNLKYSQIMSNQKRELQIIYKIIEEKGEIKPKELLDIANIAFLDELNKELPERTLRKYLSKLVSLGVVKAEGDVRWRIYKLK